MALQAQKLNEMLLGQFGHGVSNPSRTIDGGGHSPTAIGYTGRNGFRRLRHRLYVVTHGRYCSGKFIGGTGDFFNGSSCFLGAGRQLLAGHSQLMTQLGNLPDRFRQLRPQPF